LSADTETAHTERTDCSIHGPPKWSSPGRHQWHHLRPTM